MGLNVGDVGAVITLTQSTTDISSMTSATIRYKKPSGRSGKWTGTVSGTYNLQYTTVAGDIDEAGNWEVQGHGTLSGWTGASTKATLPVGEVI